MHYTQEQPATEPVEPATAEHLPPAADQRPGDDRPADDEQLAVGASDRASQAATRDPRPDLADYEPL